MRSSKHGLVAITALASFVGLGCEEKAKVLEQPAPSSEPAAVAQTQPAQAPAAPAAAAPQAASIGTQVRGSCSVMGISCSDFQGDAPTAPVKAMCEKYGGKFSDGPCPRAKIQGICTKLEPPFRNVTYTYPPGTAETAKTACANTPGGVYSTP